MAIEVPLRRLIEETAAAVFVEKSDTLEMVASGKMIECDGNDEEKRPQKRVQFSSDIIRHANDDDAWTRGLEDCKEITIDENKIILIDILKNELCFFSGCVCIMSALRLDIFAI